MLARVPYRENRAVIFDSALFHQTDVYQFRRGYRSRRINLTLLYGMMEKVRCNSLKQQRRAPSRPASAGAAAANIAASFAASDNW